MPFCQHARNTDHARPATLCACDEFPAADLSHHQDMIVNIAMSDVKSANFLARDSGLGDEPEKEATMAG